MKNVKTVSLLCAVTILYFISGCTGNKEHGEKGKSKISTEHALEVKASGENEESGIQFKKTDKYDFTRNGAHLILKYDNSENAFKGTVENTTQKLLPKVRVEVHLSNGTELGPTKPRDLNPGEKMEIALAAGKKEFENWSAHPEVGSEEHSSGEEGEHSSEHEKRERGEHARESGHEHR